MPYYPTFGFFPEELPGLDDLATCVAAHLPDADYEVAADAAGDDTIVRASVASDHHTLAFEAPGADYVFAELWDFESDVYDDGGPSPELQQAKRSLATTALICMVEHGALLAYSSGADDKYGAGYYSHFDSADAVLAALATDPPGVADRLASAPPLWLLATAGEPLDGGLAELLAGHFDLVAEHGNVRVWEHELHRPLFLS